MRFVSRAEQRVVWRGLVWLGKVKKWVVSLALTYDDPRG